MLKLGRVTKVKMLFLVLVLVFNFNLFKFSAAIFEKGLFTISTKLIKPYYIIYTSSKSPIYLSFIHIYHFDMLSLAVWQDTCHTYKNLLHDLVHDEPPIA